jgi:hypothetical protein
MIDRGDSSSSEDLDSLEAQLDRVQGFTPKKLDESKAETAESAGDKRSFIDSGDLDSALSTILIAIAAVAALLVVFGLRQPHDANHSQILLGLGVELLAGTAVVFLLRVCANPRDDSWPHRCVKDWSDYPTYKTQRTWWIRYYTASNLETCMVRTILLFGLLVIGITSFAKYENWSMRLAESVGIELLGAGILLALYESFATKFKKNKADEKGARDVLNGDVDIFVEDATDGTPPNSEPTLN